MVKIKVRLYIRYAAYSQKKETFCIEVFANEYYLSILYLFFKI